MDYYQARTLESDVNRVGSKLWCMMNENSKAANNRNWFVQQHGGFFTKQGKQWLWTSAVKEKNGYWLKRADTGEKVFFENMTEFGKQNGLTPVKICELLNGKRKTYKGWTAVEIREVKDGVGSYENAKEEVPKKVAITKSYTFIDKTTNEQILVNNLFQFAKANNLDYGNLKKLANGKSKTYKNLKLYNPLEGYKVSPDTK